MLRNESMWNELSDGTAAAICGGAECPEGYEVDTQKPCCEFFTTPWVLHMPGYCCIPIPILDLGQSSADANAEAVATGPNATTSTETIAEVGPGLAHSGSSSSATSG